MSSENPEATGAIRGKVTDQDGEDLPGVVVQVESESMLGPHTTVTRVNGEYMFELLPVGEYTLIATMTGMNTVKRTNIAVRMQQTTVVNVVMTPAAIQE